jgi:hypothetical protein
MMLYQEHQDVYVAFKGPGDSCSLSIANGMPNRKRTTESTEVRLSGLENRPGWQDRPKPAQARRQNLRIDDQRTDAIGATICRVLVDGDQMLL